MVLRSAELKPSVILLATKPASVVVFEKMLKAGWNIASVVVPSKYDQSWMPSPTLADMAVRHGVPVYSKQDEVPVDKVDFVVSYMYRHLVKSQMIAKAAVAALNFHPAPLPEYGGFAFYNVAILERSKHYGATCHHLDAGFDTGSLVKVRLFDIDPEAETAVSLERRTQIEMLLLFDEFMQMAESGNAIPAIPQDPERHRYMTLEQFEQLKVIDAAASTDEIQRVARAFWYPPYSCGYISGAYGSRIQIVPDIVLRGLGELLHQDDYVRLNEHV